MLLIIQQLAFVTLSERIVNHNDPHASSTSPICSYSVVIFKQGQRAVAVESVIQELTTITKWWLQSESANVHFAILCLTLENPTVCKGKCLIVGMRKSHLVEKLGSRSGKTFLMVLYDDWVYIVKHIVYLVKNRALCKPKSAVIFPNAIFLTAELFFISLLHQKSLIVQNRRCPALLTIFILLFSTFHFRIKEILFCKNTLLFGDFSWLIKLRNEFGFEKFERLAWILVLNLLINFRKVILLWHYYYIIKNMRDYD